MIFAKPSYVDRTPAARWWWWYRLSLLAPFLRGVQVYRFDLYTVSVSLQLFKKKRVIFLFFDFFQLFSIIVFGSISSKGWTFDSKKEVCLYYSDANACNYGVGIGRSFLGTCFSMTLMFSNLFGFLLCRCHRLLGCSCAACWRIFLPTNVFGENQTSLCHWRPCFLWWVPLHFSTKTCIFFHLCTSLFLWNRILGFPLWSGFHLPR